MPSEQEDLPDVTVIGAGIVGICIALSLLKAGRTVGIIDQAGPGEGASTGNAGVISPWSCIPQTIPGRWKQVPRWLLNPDGPVRVRWDAIPAMLPWAQKFFRVSTPERVPLTADAMSSLIAPSISLYRQWLSGTGKEHLLADSWYVHPLRAGQIMDPDAWSWRLRRERGATIEVVDGPALRDIEPAVSPAFEGAVLVKDQARATSPGDLCKALADKAFAGGVSFVRSAVHSLKPDGADKFTIDTSDGKVNAKKVVVAAGAWSNRLLEPLGFKLPLIAERGYHLMFEDPGIKINHSVMDMESMIVVSLMQGGVRAAGTAEFSRLESQADYRRAQMLAGQTQQLFPGLNTSQTREWVGVRPSLPDSLPAIGAVPGHPGLFGAFGHSHYGMSMAPGTGDLVAALVSGQDCAIAADPYRLNRFS